MARTRNCVGVVLTVMIPLALIAYGVGLDLDNEHKEPITTVTQQFLSALPPLNITATCLLRDARGLPNPVCAGLASQLSAWPSGRFAGIPAVSLLVPFADNATTCGAAVPLASTATTRDSGNFQSQAYASEYDIQMARWAPAGSPLGLSLSPSTTTCAAAASGSSDASGSTSLRQLGSFPVCPFVTSTQVGPFVAAVPVGGVGFVVQAPAIATGDADFNGAWAAGPCAQSFAFTIQPSPAHGIKSPIPLLLPAAAVEVQAAALSSYAQWTRSTDVSARLSVLQYDVTLERTIALDGSTSVTASVVPTQSALSTAPVNPIFWTEREQCVALAACGDLFTVPAEAYAGFAAAAAAVAAAPALASLPATAAATAAAVAVMDVISGVPPSQLAADVAGAGAPALSAGAAAALAASVAALVPASVVTAFTAARAATTTDASGTVTSQHSCVDTATNRTAWQVASAGCGLGCSASLPAAQLRVLAQQGRAAADGSATVAVFLQRAQVGLTCAAPSLAEPIASPPSASLPDPGTFQLVDGPTTTFVRGPLLSLAVVLRTTDIMLTIKTAPTKLTAFQIATQTLGMYSIVFSVFLTIKQLLARCERKKPEEAGPGSTAASAGAPMTVANPGAAPAAVIENPMLAGDAKSRAAGGPASAV